jgi:hypothetical protein
VVSLIFTLIDTVNEFIYIVNTSLKLLSIILVSGEFFALAGKAVK